MKRYISLASVSVAVLALSGCVSAGVDKTVELSVGQTRHLTAYRAENCGAAPLSFAAVAGKLPNPGSSPIRMAAFPVVKASSAAAASRHAR